MPEKIDQTEQSKPLETAKEKLEKMNFKRQFEPRLTKAVISQKTNQFIAYSIAKNRYKENIFAEIQINKREPEFFTKIE